MDKTHEFCPDVAYGVMCEKTDDFKKIEKAFRGKNQLDGFDLVLSRDGLFQLLSDDEKSIFSMVVHKESIAYNGIFLGSDSFRIYSTHYVGYDNPHIVLLRSENYPEVTLSRSNISSLPLSVYCEISVILYKILCLSENYRIYYADFGTENTWLCTEDEYFSILNSHETWKELFRYRDKCVSEINDETLVEDIMSDIRKTPLARSLFFLKLAMLKQKFKVSFDFEDCKGFRVSEKVSEETSCFPVEMFFYPEGISDFFGCVLELFDLTGSYYNGIVYNAEHRFSRWLIHNRRELINKVPRYYEEVISVMVRSHSPEDIINSLNKILKRLAGFPGNPFDVTKELYLKPDEIKKQKKEDD